MKDPVPFSPFSSLFIVQQYDLVKSNTISEKKEVYLNCFFFVKNYIFFLLKKIICKTSALEMRNFKGLIITAFNLFSVFSSFSYNYPFCFSGCRRLTN